MARREPATDAYLRELAVRRFRQAPRSQGGGEDGRRFDAPDFEPRNSGPPWAVQLPDGPLLSHDGRVKKLILDDTSIPSDRKYAIIAAVHEEIELYRTNKAISEHERPASQGEALRLQVVRWEHARTSLWEQPSGMPIPSAVQLKRRRLVDDDLQAQIVWAKAEIERLEKRVSPSESKKLATLLRNDLAVGLKGIAIGHLGKPERKAEAWATYALDAVKADHPELNITYPSPDDHAADFRRMFRRHRQPGTPPPDHVANVRHWRREFARRRQADALYQQKLRRLREEEG